MIDHISIAVSDLMRSTAFYEAVLAPLELNKLVTREGMTVGFGKKYPEFWLNAREGLSPQPETTGTHICLRAVSEESVRAFHAAALAQGGKTAGDPGPRQAAFTTYTGAVIFDLDGNKIEAVYFPTKLGETTGFAGAPKAP
ncbi:MAG TPA: VOC family protein [Rhizomicrobium sp.]|nr:VOC family protein [Rhizomicrobium sp.]